MTDTKKGVGNMHLEQFKEREFFIKAKLVGIQGHWEDAAALFWATEMKRLGREPYRDDPAWNKLVDSKGNQLYGTKKSRIHGMWLKWKKPLESSFAESTVSEELAAALNADVGRETEKSDVWEEDSPGTSSIWNHPALEDFFLDGFFKPGSRPTPARGCVASFTSSVVLAMHIVEKMEGSPQHSATDGRAVAAVHTALADLIATLGALPGPPGLLNGAIALAGRFLPRGLAAAAGITAAAGGGSSAFGGRDEGLVAMIDRVVSRIRQLGDGDVCMAPAGWVREDGSGRILVGTNRFNPRLLASNK